MRFEELELGDNLENLEGLAGRSWALLGEGQLDHGSCFVADATDRSRPRVAGFLDGAIGDVFACSQDEAPGLAAGGGVDRGEPAVHVIGSLDGDSGQVTVRQEQGNYLRACRWDRLQPQAGAFQGALLRTLPQCGCGGSLGTPKLFGSFAEMSAYHFCAFYLA